MLASILFAVAAASAPSAPSAPSACVELNATSAMAACLNRETKAADVRLNAAYRAARSRVPAKQAKALQVAQRAWITFRDSNCRAYAAGEGTIAQVETAQCAFSMTTQRADELENFRRPI